MNKCIERIDKLGIVKENPTLRYVDRYVPDPGCYNISY